MSEHRAPNAGIRQGEVSLQPYAGGMAVLPWGRELTRADLDDLPDDGHRYELLDGSLLVTPAPRPAHQVAVGELFTLLRDATAGSEMLTMMAPLEIALSAVTVLQPDVLVVRRDDLDDRGAAGVPMLVVEVLSPSTRRFDLGSKKSAYESAGVPNYWVVDPDVPSLIAWRLHNGSYVDEAGVSGDEQFRSSEPVQITVVPADLVRPLRG